MKTASRYAVFCRAAELRSFTLAGMELGYSQSAVSQIVKSLEEELGTKLITRSRGRFELTADGKEYFPYFEAIKNAEDALIRRRLEITGMEDATIRVASFTSVSRELLPELMKNFKETHPGVNFVIKQGEYNSIRGYIEQGEVDFGFISTHFSEGLESSHLYDDELAAVLPKGHPLAKKKTLRMKDLTNDPFILFDEGRDYNTVLEAFREKGLEPKTEYDIYDDYSILGMVRRGFGISVQIKRIVKGFEEGLEVRDIEDAPLRSVSLAWRSRETMPFASREFLD
jgi:DNA-binding transcriptional LysR family regulator